MASSTRDLEGVKETLRILKRYIDSCKSGDVDLAYDIPTQVYKLVFDRNHRGPTLLERALSPKIPLFHPFISRIRPNMWLMHSPAGKMHFRDGEIDFVLFDLLQSPIPVKSDWGAQIIMVGTVTGPAGQEGQDVTLLDFIQHYRDKEPSHFDPRSTPILDASKSIRYVSRGIETRQELVLAAVGEYVVDRVRELVSPDTHHLCEWGCRLANLEHYEAALARFQEAIGYDPANHSAIRGSGQCLVRLGRPDDGIQQLKWAISVRDDVPATWHALGSSLAMCGRYDEAIHSYQRATEINPDFAIAWFKWGVVLEEVGDVSAAIEKYEKAIGLDATLREYVRQVEDFSGNDQDASVADDPQTSPLTE